jgi:hypothetical protein
VFQEIELLGARPTMVGLSLAVPTWSEGFERAGPQLYVDFFHAF